MLQEADPIWGQAQAQLQEAVRGFAKDRRQLDRSGMRS
jgi:hypothetical protein